MIFGVEYQLTEVEARVLGALLEKETTTPEYYPLSLNALMNACNQKSNREPVMSLDEDAVRGALRSLTDQMLVRPAASDGRVAKYEHRLQEAFNFHRNEAAVLCVLLLRGPQTPGELRNRTERLYSFDDLESVHSALNLLMRREPPLVKVLARQPGTKEARFAHLLCGEAGMFAPAQSSDAAVLSVGESPERIERCEAEIETLKSEIAALRQQLEELQKLLR
jgi:hypothetical protein